MSTPDGPVALRDNPYFGLDYYGEEFGAWFFGRESECGKIITNLQATRLTLLHAESGVGKSSLLRAGVAWRLRRIADDRFTRHRPVRTVPVVFNSWKDDPVLDLAKAVGQAVDPYLAERPRPESPAGGLELAIEQAAGTLNANLLIMLDQFEEYFLYRSREPVPGRFADELARCVNRSDLRANFLIAIREDAYAGLGDLFKGRITNVYGNYLHIDYLDRAAAERAVREPLAVYNSQCGAAGQVTLDDDLVAAVLDEVRAFADTREKAPGGMAAAADGMAAANEGADRIATPLLQLVMERVWNTERAEGSHQLRLSTLQRLRGVSMIVDSHLGNALHSLGGAERQTALDMFVHLVTPSGGKIAESVSDLANRTGHREAQVGGVLAKLDHERIVRPVPAAPGQDPMRFRRYEIFHDVLAPTINRAIAAREEQRRTSRIRRLAVLAVALCVVVSGIALAIALALGNANNEKSIAQSRQVAAEAAQILGQDPELSLELALQAVRLHDTSEAEAALRAALPRVQTVRSLQDGSYVFAAAMDPADSNEAADSDASGVTWIWNVKTGQHLARLALGGFSSTGTADSVAFNPSGTEVAVGYASGAVAVFDARSGKKLQSTMDGTDGINAVKFVGNAGEVAIAADQNVALWQFTAGTKCCDVLLPEQAYNVVSEPGRSHEFALATDNGVVLVDASGPGKPRTRRLSTQPAYDAGFSPDGSEIVAASIGGNVIVYQIATGKATTLYAGYPRAGTAAFSPDGKYVVAGYGDGTALVWDVATRLPLTVLAGNAGAVDTAGFSADGSEVVTGGADGTVRVWYDRPRELQAEFTSPANSAAPPFLYGADYIGNRIITYGQDDRLRVFTASGQQVASINPGLADPGSLDWNRAGTKIVMASSDGPVDLWQVAGSAYTLVRLQTPINVSQSTGMLTMSQDGSRLAIVADNGYAVQVRSAETGGLQRTLNADSAVEDIVISPDNRQIVAADFAGQVELWNGKATQPVVLGGSGPYLDSIAFDQSGSEFVTLSVSGVVDVWDATSYRLVSSVDACPSPDTAAMSPDDTKVVVACGDGTIRVFDVTSGQPLVVLPATTEGFVAFAGFSPDGKSIVATIDSGNTGFVEVWNAELATASLPALEQLANERVTDQLTPAQRQEYLPSG
jgi:WD40 repeat protein